VRFARRLSGLRRLVRGTALFFCAAPVVHAAGGHFAVDDAAILDPDQCQLESWEEFETGGARSLFHFGPSCRVGPVELGLNVDRLRSRGRDSSTVFGPQVKWAVAVDDDFSVGFVGLVGWQGKAPRYAGATLYLPFSLHVAPPLWLHANGGRDWYRGAPSTSRLGLALEWDLGTTWTMTGELFRQASGNFARLGTRWQASPNVSIDLSRASALGVRSSGWWSLGANWAFEVDRARP
jgi:hypothetical protein